MRERNKGQDENAWNQGGNTGSQDVNAENQGGNIGNQGGNAGNQGGNVGIRGVNAGNRMEQKQKKKKKKFIKSNFRNIKPHYQGLMLSFSCNDPDKRYYLNGMWTCGPPVMILNFLSSNEKVRLHFAQCC